MLIRQDDLQRKLRLPGKSGWEEGGRRREEKKAYSCTYFMLRASNIHIIESYTATRMHESKLHVAIELKLDKTMLRYKRQG